MDGTRPTHERRIARRVAPTGELRLGLAPEAKRRWWQPNITTIDCRVLDMSVTGARMVVPRTFRCTPGTSFGISFRGWGGTAYVVRVADAEDPEHLELAIEFRRLSPALRAVVDEVVAGDRRHLDTAWRIAS